MGNSCSTVVEVLPHDQEVIGSNLIRCLQGFFFVFLFLLSFISCVQFSKARWSVPSQTQTFQEKLTESRLTISDQESQLTESGTKLAQAQKDLDSKRGEVERLTLQLSEISGNAMTSAKSLTTRNDSLQKMVRMFLM